VKQNSALVPIAHIDPTNWIFNTAISGTSANPPLNEFGTFWEWYSYPGLSGGKTLSGFSFTTQIAPTTSAANNYFIYSPVSGATIREYGHIAAPITLALIQSSPNLQL
jgi:hypothetical protein